MQLREKIGGLFVVGFDGLEPPPSLIDLIRNFFIGGVILFRRNIKSCKQLQELSSALNDAAGGRKFLISIDCEGGRVFRLPPPFPQWGTLAEIGDEFLRSKDPSIAYKRGAVMALALADIGVNLNFMPVLDVNTNIKNPIIGDRAFSSDPRIVAELGVQMMKGLHDGGVLACGKHFPGHGDTSSDSHLTLPRLPHTMNRLESVELPPYESAIANGLKMIMTAHVVYEGIDAENPATLSKTIINGILRRRLGFDGAVISDDLLMRAIVESYSLPDASVKALQSGCDIILISRDNDTGRTAIEGVISAVSAGLIPEKMIENSYRRVESLLPI